ncbi:hypothetical protein CRUP_020431 [Coryphaenoides rupestris]|nr:hypothetical protein CRUP_020431 [Coryphaenoides rupestris]
MFLPPPELIYKRNERMARRISALLQRNPAQTYFFAFGAGHFLGNHSVLDILRQQGYEIVHTPSDQQETPPVEPAAAAADSERRDEKTAVGDSSQESTPVATPASTPGGWGTGSPEAEEAEGEQEEEVLDDDQEEEEEEEEGEEEEGGGLGEEEDLPHMLLPDSLSQLEEFGRHKRPRKAHRGHGRTRLFSDLWVRMEDSSTPPPDVRVLNGYVTVVPPLTGQEQHRRAELYPAVQRPSSTASPYSTRHHHIRSHSSSSARSGFSCTAVATCLLAWLLSHVLFTS